MTKTDSDNSRELSLISIGLIKDNGDLKLNKFQIEEIVESALDVLINHLEFIDSDIYKAMDGWRLKRLPRIDRDILRLAYVDINFLETPLAVACDEAVNLANKYSDMQGRKFINGVLRRLQTVKLR